MSALLTIGLDKDGREVKIDEAAHGKDCNCFCPICKNPLVAKNRVPLEHAKREHHFAHQKGYLCDANDETVLHQFAKEIIFEEKALMLPISRNGNRPSGLVHFRDVALEKRDEQFGIRPDAEAILENGERLLIEFMVSHEVSSKKRRIIVDNKLNCIEINLNYVQLDKEAIRSFLLKETEDREWIGPAEKKGESGDSYSFYQRNPIHFKVLDYIKEQFDSGNLNIVWNGKKYNLKSWGYDVCEPSKEFKKFRMDLLMLRSQKKDDGKIAISVRGRRRNSEHKTPRGLRVIDIIVRNDSDYHRLTEGDSLTLVWDDITIIFEGFQHQMQTYDNYHYGQWNNYMIPSTPIETYWD
jgi:hypothetical protein